MLTVDSILRLIVCRLSFIKLTTGTQKKKSNFLIDQKLIH